MYSTAHVLGHWPLRHPPKRLSKPEPKTPSFPKRARAGHRGSATIGLGGHRRKCRAGAQRIRLEAGRARVGLARDSPVPARRDRRHRPAWSSGRTGGCFDRMRKPSSKSAGRVDAASAISNVDLLAVHQIRQVLVERLHAVLRAVRDVVANLADRGSRRSGRGSSASPP